MTTPLEAIKAGIEDLRACMGKPRMLESAFQALLHADKEPS